MDNVLKVLPIFSAVITITLGLLSLSQNFKNEGAFRSLLTIALCITPFIFIQQVIIFTSTYFNLVSIFYGIFVFLLLCISTIKAIELFKNKKLVGFDRNAYLVFITNLFFLLVITFKNTRKFNTNYLFCGELISSVKSNYIEKLSTYKIEPNMFYFLSNNIQITAYYVVITAIMIYQIFSFVSMFLKFCTIYSDKIYECDMEKYKFVNKYIVFLIFNFILMLVCHNIPSIIESVFGLFP